MNRILPGYLALPLLAAAQIHFVEHTVATGIAGGYHVAVADLNHDGKPDLIAVGLNTPELAWFENPTWERHVIAGNLPRMVVNCAAVEVNGQAQIVLLTAFAMQAKDGAGVLSVLTPTADPRAPWNIREIDRLPTSHRVRVADIDGSGKPVVIVAPLNGAKAAPPDYRDLTPLAYYVPGEWKRHEIKPENFGLVHGIWITDWDGNKRDAILTAGFEGIELFRFTAKSEWTRTELVRGDPGPWPKSGAGDIAVGHLGSERFLVSIEPFHGNQVVVYRSQNGNWTRQVIDDSLVNGHTLQTIDADGDGRDEIVASCQGNTVRNLYLYHADDPVGQHWSRQIIDNGGMSGATCVVADFNGDHRPDLACIGSTANLKWYENR